MSGSYVRLGLLSHSLFIRLSAIQCSAVFATDNVDKYTINKYVVQTGCGAQRVTYLSRKEVTGFGWYFD